MVNVVINEWLPNPTGNDAAGEFVELKNESNATVNVSGWTLVTKGKKKEKITGTISPDGSLLLNRKQTKLVLKNSDEGLALYDATGRLVDESSFVGSAPDGKSFNRVDGIIGAAQNFAWGNPTPGAANEAIPVVVTQTAVPQFGVPINRTASSGGVFFMMMTGVAILLTSLVLYSIKTNENLSDVFFNRDEAIG